ncbi:hypothetical protein QQF64_035721 [Cirrhinus molitorella]|uniref:Uncharacterized protein n=1 Tax=Cirrhinus molitorella TaxID=172907 RepID=A0ABR3NHC0_9TELE
MLCCPSCPTRRGPAGRGESQRPPLRSHSGLRECGHPRKPGSPSPTPGIQSAFGNYLHSQRHPASIGSSVTTTAMPGAWPVEVGIVKDLPFPVVLGRDWPGFDRLLAAATLPVSPSGSRRKSQWMKGVLCRPVLLASDRARGGESPSLNLNLFFDVFQQVAEGGVFSKAQHEEDCLKHCWAQVRVIEGKEVQPAPHPVPHFIVKNGLLYCVASQRGEEKTLLVVPQAKTETDGTGPLASNGRPPWSPEYHPADP